MEHHSRAAGVFAADRTAAAGHCDRRASGRGRACRRCGELAAEAGVNPNTMQKALQELESRGLMQTQRTAGRTVTGDTALLEALRRQQAEAYAGEFLQKMQALGLTPQQVQELLHRMSEQKGESNV